MAYRRRGWRAGGVALSAFVLTVVSASCSGSGNGLGGPDGGGDGQGSHGGPGGGDGSRDGGRFVSHDAGSDCGGRTGNPCGDGAKCQVGADCQSGLCDKGVCAAPPTSCNDGKRDGSETDVDCGGSVCAPCGTGKDCKVGADCVSDVCAGGKCQAATSADGVKNDSETGVDCGGALQANGKPNPSSDHAPPCVPGKTCVIGSDCTEGVCDTTPPGAADAGIPEGGVPDGAVTDASHRDAGGGALYCQPATDNDGVVNDSETDVDCGGGFVDGKPNPRSDGAPPCAVGKACFFGTDCVEGVCNDNGGMGGPPADCPSAAGCTCQPPSPNDGVKNGGETDVDCGGSSSLGSDGAPPCAPGLMCLVGADCQSFICGTNGLCTAPSPADGVKNDSETDVDCGGATLAAGGANPMSDGASPCADAKACALDTDCLSGFCSLLDGTCVDAQSCKGLVTPAPILDQTGVVNADGTVTVNVDANGDAVGVPDPNGVGQSAGIDTCGPGESTDPISNQQHESCCKSLLMPGSTTLRMDKYEVTSGRIRQFLEALSYDVRDWALAQFDATGAPTTQAGTMLAMQIPTSGVTGVTNGVGTGPGTNALYLLPHSADPSEPLNAVIETGALVLDTSGTQGCTTGFYMGSPLAGAGTYWWDAPTVYQQASSPPRPFTQDYYDIKPMNCIPYYLAAAFCAWDGGRLPTQPEHASVWGTASYPWGAASPPVLFAGQAPATFLAQAAAAFPDAYLPIVDYTVDWHDSNLGAATGQGDFYFYPSWITNTPNQFVPDSLSTSLDLSPYISAPGRFFLDRTTATSTSFGDGEGWQDLGADMIEWAGVTTVTGGEQFCDLSGVLGAGESYNCACGNSGCFASNQGVIRGNGLPPADILGGSWEGHGIVETLAASWSFYRQYGKLGLRCVRPAEPAP